MINGIAAFQSAISALHSAIRLNEPLARYTTARIGGPADVLVEATSAADLKDIVSAARQSGVPCAILGGGANVLVSDAGRRGLVIINRAKRTIKFGVNPARCCQRWRVNASRAG